jgi:outer membrane protein OmpA-like peptidoglycan-associated protein
MKHLLIATFLLASTGLFAGDNDRFKVRHLEMNSEESDIAPMFYNGKVVFASSRDINTVVKRVWDKTNLGYYDLFIGEPGGAGEIVKMKYFNRKFNAKYNEGPASFNKDGDFIAFTQNYYESKKVKTLKIMTSQLVEGKWEDPIHVPFNNPDYNVGHPTLTLDGSTMYFVSDMPGGYGGSDIYSVSRNEDGTWGRPKNMGDQVNSAGNEMFPFIHRDGLLFFASDREGGMGGLDIYMTNVFGGNRVEHLDAPVNSPADDFSFILSTDQYSGYFASNREGGAGSDDLYAFTNSEKFVNISFIKGVVADMNGNIMDGATVSLMDNNGAEVKVIETDKNGKFEFNVDPNTPYSLVVQKDTYFPTIEKVQGVEVSETAIVSPILDKNPNISLLGVVTDRESGKPVSEAKVKLINIDSGEEVDLTANNNGIFTQKLAGKKLNDRINYNVRIEADGYLTLAVNYNRLVDREGQYDLNAEIDLKLEKVKIGETKLEDVIDIQPIFWDLGSAKVRVKAMRELDKIVAAMEDNPKMEIELGSHTDSRGSAASNMSLSDRRAKAAADYIKSRITNPGRITGKGYGESRLVNECKDGVNCSEEQHQENRRTEFRITKF